jgi:hypothetical protein
MKISPEQHATLVQHLTGHAKGDFKCAICGNVDWGVEGVVLSLSEFYPDPDLTPAWSSAKGRLPVVICSCTTCGYSFLVNAVTAGLVPRPPSSPLGRRT